MPRVYEAVKVKKGVFMVRCLYTDYRPIYCLDVFSTMKKARETACLYSGIPVSEMESYQQALEKRREECKKNGVYIPAE